MIKTFYFNDLRTCCYILWDEALKCLIVDPGCYSESEHSRLVDFIEKNGLTPLMILNTHGHFDHVMGNVFVSQKWGIPIYMNKGDIPHLARTKSYGGYFGYDIQQPSEDVVDLKEGDIIAYGNSTLKVFLSPGHSRGGVLFYNEKENFLLSGDSLFSNGVGRTDLPGGDYDDLIESIKTKIFTLPPTTIVYPGHGPSTTIETEMSRFAY